MEKELGIIWLNEGDRHFTEENIGKVLRLADKEFKRVVIVSPSSPAQHTFRALGYEESEVIKKAKLSSDLLKNRAMKELSKVNHKNKFHIVNWESEILASQNYDSSLQEMMQLYEQNLEFREDARAVTKKALGGKFENKKKLEKALDEAVLHLIEELAFVLACPKEYSVDRAAYIYHKEWEIFEDLITGRYDNKNRKDFRFVLCN